MFISWDIKCGWEMCSNCAQCYAPPNAPVINEPPDPPHIPPSPSPSPPPPYPPPSLPPMPVPPCETFEYLAKYKPESFEGLSESGLFELRALARLLCKAVKPCPSETPFNDPRDVCSMCNGALPPPGQSALSLSACLATVDWACCSDSPAKAVYPFCSVVPDSGYTINSVMAEDLSELTKWWTEKCADRVALKEQYFADTAASTATVAARALGNFKGVQARQQATQAQGARVLNLLATSGEGSVMRRVAALREHLEVRSCDEDARSSGHELLSEVLGRSEPRRPQRDRMRTRGVFSLTPGPQ